MKKISLEKLLKILLGTFLFFLPWQTVYIFREVFLGGVKIESWTLNFYATEILLWLMILVFMSWYWKNFKFQISNFKFQISRDRIFIFSVLLFIIYHLSSVIWATDRSLALQQSVRVMEGILLFFIIFLGPLKSKEVVKYLLLGSILPAVLGIGQFLLQNTFACKWLGLVEHISHDPGASVIVGESIGRWLRAYGSFTHPNVFGGYLVLILILVTYHISHITYYFSKKVWHVLCVLCYVIITALFFTFSRSAWLVMFICLFVYLFISLERKQGFLKNRKIFLLLIAYGLLLTAIFFPLVQTRLLGGSAHEVASVIERISGYEEAWQIFKTQPWFGVGAGNYTVASYNLNFSLDPWLIQPVHNVMILYVVEIGIFGTILFLSIIGGFIRYQLSDISYQKRWLIILLFAICYLLLASFDHYFYTSYIGLALSGIYFGLLVRDLHS